MVSSPPSEAPGATRASSVSRKAKLTSFLSFRFVNMTMVADFCSQIILQKSLTVSCLGPVDRG